MQYDNLIGLPYKHGENDCYGLLRRFYKQNFNIDLPNFARPFDFHKHGMNLFGENYYKVGFRPLDCHPSGYIPGDVILMAIRSRVANHCAILVENGKLLHHLLNQRSVVEPYSGIWRTTTLNVFRHKDVTPRMLHSESNFIDMLPLRKNAIRAATQSTH